jgi:small conductance mechanosensitive channel
MGVDMQIVWRSLVLMALLGAGYHGQAWARGAVTTAQPAIPVDELDLRLKPLTRAQLKVEADGWLQLLQAKVKEISDAEISAMRKKQALADAGRDTRALTQKAEPVPATSPGDKPAPAATQQADERNVVLNKLTQLREQQSALVDRTGTVVNAFEKKGGASDQVQEYRQYIDAVSGLRVDVSDAQAVWTTVTGWLKSGEGGLRWARNMLMFLVIVVVFVVLSGMAAKATNKVLTRSRRVTRLLGDFMVTTVRRLVLAIGVIVGLAAMEVNVGPLLAVIGAAGFVIAFALQNSLGNFASGILILVFRPFDVGDVIEVAGVIGKVQSMNLLSINITTPDNKSVIVANNQVWDGAITNITGSDTRRVDLVFGIAYSDDIDHARKVLEELVGAHAKVLETPEPVIRLHELGDSSVNFICRPWVLTADYWEVYWDLTAAVKQRFDREGISIPFPQRDVHLFQTTTESNS